LAKILVWEEKEDGGETCDCLGGWAREGTQSFEGSKRRRKKGHEEELGERPLGTTDREKQREEPNEFREKGTKIVVTRNWDRQ